MSTTKLLMDFDPATGISHNFEMDENTGWVTISAEQNVDNLLEHNKALYNENSLKGKGEWHHAASIPTVLYAGLVAEGKDVDQRYMRRWLNDPDNRYFRTSEGRV